MSGTIKRFDFEIVKIPTGDDTPHLSPVVHITVDEWTEEDGVFRISDQLMSGEEIDTYVVALKDELDAVARRAKAALKKALEETQTTESERMANREADDSIR